MRIFKGVLRVAVLATSCLACAGTVTSNPHAWKSQAEEALARIKRPPKPIDGAKNVILFVGDGMGVTTVTAARILAGQRAGGMGEDHELAFERFPHLALVKTYSANQQVADSAPTMTALVTGVKTNDGLLSLSEDVPRGSTDPAVAARGRLQTLFELAEARGLATGLVTTTRLTHATPAACYAHSPERDWESDADLPEGAVLPDIAAQFVDFAYGDGIDVALGGGRSQFRPSGAPDPEYPDQAGLRRRRDLVQEWLDAGRGRAVVWDKKGLDALGRDGQVLGLFEPSHMRYEVDRSSDPGGEPSLAEMTRFAIGRLAGRRYLLMVEGGRIDHAHHAGNAQRALLDTIAFSDAVRAAVEMTREEETLILVTADHSHTLTMAGYPRRGNPVLGLVIPPGDGSPARDLSGRTYSTLAYANGPGFLAASDSQPAGAKLYPHRPARAQGGFERESPSATEDLEHLQESLVPLESETHGGEDVAVYARGPGSHWVRGVLEQNVIFYIMRDALGLIPTGK